MYNKIYNPQTRGWVDINSRKGKIVLQQYVMEFMNTPEQTGGTTWSDLKKQKKRELDIKHAVHRERISHIQDHALKAQIDLVEDPSRCAERLLIAEREKAHLEEEIKILQLQLKEYSTDKTPKAVLLSSSVSCKTKMGDDGFLIDEPEGCSPQVAFLKAEREAAVEAEAVAAACEDRGSSAAAWGVIGAVGMAGRDRRGSKERESQTKVRAPLYDLGGRRRRSRPARVRNRRPSSRDSPTAS